MNRSISISRLQNTLVATVQVDLCDQVLNVFRQQLLEKVGLHSVNGVLIDLSEVKTLDTADMNKLITIMDSVAVMGRRCILIGIRPGIAMALVNLDFDIDKLVCAANIDDGLQLIGGKE